MKKNILEMLEKTQTKYPDKISFSDENESVSYSEIVDRAKAVGTALGMTDAHNKPIAIMVDKSVKCIAAMFGVVYSGNFYVVLDCQMPVERIEKILAKLDPFALIVAEKYNEKSKELNFQGKLFDLDDLLKTTVDKELIDNIRNKQIDTDPVYVIFTSGSTGMPKGIVVGHRSLINYANWVVTTFDINCETVFGSQAQFYFSACILEIFATINSGAAFHMIPKSHFSFPVNLIKFMIEKQINTVYWVPSVLRIIANSKVLDLMEMPTLKKVLFVGEVMPVKQLNVWMEHYPNVYFANLYGPTEITDVCTYFPVTQRFPNDSTLPIGNAADNCDVIILNEKNEAAGTNEEGELCVRGSILAMGYYNDPEKTDEVFVQNPLNNHYPEKIYRTGDLVKYNEKGEILYLTRKDFQIKHMGYRIELGEIEAISNSIPGMLSCACLYDGKKDKIVFVFEGDGITDDQVLKAIKAKLPSYMHPNKIIHLDNMPHNENGKINRKALMEII